MNTLWIAFSLFLLMDSLGNIPMYVSYLKDIPPKRQYFIIIRELLIALVIIILFAFIGEALMKFLHIGKETIQIAGGIILFILALKMIFPGAKQTDIQLDEDEELFIVPLAVPLVAGPATLSTVMLYSRQVDSNWMLVLAIILAWLPTTIILLGSALLSRILGKKGLIACQRLMGLILILIAVEMFLAGTRTFIGK